MAAIAVSNIGWKTPAGNVILEEVCFHVGDREHVTLVGANGTGKTTMLRILAGEERPTTGSVSITGKIGVMHQLVGSIRDSTTVRDVLVHHAPQRIRSAAEVLQVSEAMLLKNTENESAQLRYAEALADWGEAGGYEAEVFWDQCCTRSLGDGIAGVEHRRIGTFSGGQQKKLVLEALLFGDHGVLLLDEPDNFLDIPSKRWLEQQITKSKKTILLVSHDRELISACSSKIVTIEAKGAWTHGGTWNSYGTARDERNDRLAKDSYLYSEERRRLIGQVTEMRRRAAISDVFSSKLKAAETQLRHFDERVSVPRTAETQKISIRLRGNRTGKKVLTCDRLELLGMTDAFDAEVWFGDRIAVIGANGAGKSHFLNLVAGKEVDHSGSVTLGARVVPGLFNQTHSQPNFQGRCLLEILEELDVVRATAMSMLKRYELSNCAIQTFDTLSGGQQARFQILLLELSGSTLLLLDEPTDNLDAVSAEALEKGLQEFEGTVIAVTHDRWFLKNFDRFLFFDDNCKVSILRELPTGFGTSVLEP
jgi:ATPase subunit of ABC transporter with duplicated ATPase domains